MQTQPNKPKFMLVLVLVLGLLLTLASVTFAQDPGASKYNRPASTPCPDHVIRQPPPNQRVGLTVKWEEADIFSPQGGSCSADTVINSESGIIFTGCEVVQQSTSAYHCLVTSDHEVRFNGTGLTPGTLNVLMQGSAVGRTGIDVDANGIFFTFLVDVKPAQPDPLPFKLYLPLGMNLGK